MPEGTSVGTIYFDLALKDTINAQLQAAAARTKAQVQHAFDGVGDQIQKSISATGTQAAQAAGAAWSKSVALAQLSLNKAVRAFEESKNQLNAAMAQVKLGEEAPKSVDALARRVDQRYAAIEELDEFVLNRLISKILIGEVKKVNGQKVQEVKIVYNFVGEIPEIAA